MTRWRWIGLLVCLLAVSVLVGLFAEPWTKLTNWFGPTEADRRWAHVALGALVFITLVALLTLAATGFPKAIKALGIEFEMASPAETAGTIENLKGAVEGQQRYIRLLEEQVRDLRELHTAAVARLEQQIADLKRGDDPSSQDDPSSGVA